VVITALPTAVKVRWVSSPISHRLKSHSAEIPVARRAEQVEGEPLMLEAHHRRGDDRRSNALHGIPGRDRVILGLCSPHADQGYEGRCATT
jgi:hypothetical protein